MKILIAVLSLLILSFKVFAAPSCEDIRAMGERYYNRCKEAPELFDFDCLDCNFQTSSDGIVRKEVGPCEKLKSIGTKYYARCLEAPELFNFDCLECNFQNEEDGIVKNINCDDMKKYFNRCKEDPENFDFDCVDCNFQGAPLASFYGCKIVPGRFVVCPDGYYHFKGSTVPSEISDVLRQMRKERGEAAEKNSGKKLSPAASQ